MLKIQIPYMTIYIIDQYYVIFDRKLSNLFYKLIHLTLRGGAMGLFFFGVKFFSGIKCF